MFIESVDNLYNGMVSGHYLYNLKALNADLDAALLKHKVTANDRRDFSENWFKLNGHRYKGRFVIEQDERLQAYCVPVFRGDA